MHVGRRIKLGRTMIGMSQGRLGSALGVSLQRVQHYERGANRVAASRLFHLSCVLEVPVAFFFDDFRGPMPDLPGSCHTVPGIGQTTGSQNNLGAVTDELGMIARRETQNLIKAYLRILSPAMRKCVLDMIKTIGKQEQQGHPTSRGSTATGNTEF